MLPARGGIDKQAVSQVAGQFGVGAEHIAVQVHRLARAQAIGTVGPGAEVRGCITGVGQVVFITVFTAHREHERPGAETQLAGQIQVRSGLAQLIITGVETGWRIGPQRNVEGAFGGRLKAIAPMGDAAVEIPVFADQTLETGGGRQVGVVAQRLRQVTVGVELRLVGGVAVELGTGGVPLVVRTE
ncbi:hypothetical protein ALP64_204697 [Pseudomonas syringae pv. actinidiae]|nr:hypothetical protein ALP64_204697 [Pseudomonas syringae pv. actinidiae]